MTARTLAAASLAVAIGATIYEIAFKWPEARRRSLYPPFVAPADNPTSAEKVALGRWLFYDRRLSFNSSTACADCHRQEFAFADPRPRSVGATGELTPRNSMTLANVAYNSRYTRANHNVRTLEQHALIPLTGRHPIEMGMNEDERGILDRLRGDPRYVQLFKAAFPDEDITRATVVKAISSFERTLVSLNAPYDRFLAGDTRALSASARRGLTLFRSDRLGCTHCHDGFNFRYTQGHRVNAQIDDTVAYHNIGLYNLSGNGSYPAGNPGLWEITRVPEDMGRFKAPTLRNVAVTGPYMHDGSVETLSDVIDIYADGGRQIAAGPNAGDGRRNPFKSPRITGFAITPDERRDLIDFLKSLTDREFLSNPRLANPFPAAH